MIGNCEICGKEIIYYPARPQRFCSKKCYGISQRVSMKVNICKHCGKEFEMYPYLIHDYCSVECGNASRRIERIDRVCLNCGIIFESRITEERKFCSNKCVGEYHTNENHHAYNLQDRLRICEYCGNEFEVDCITNTKKYCNQICMGKTQEGENHWMWRGDELLFTCDNCGIEYRTDSIKKKTTRNFCSSKCMHDYMQGENHPCWRGGLTYIDYPREFSEKLKEQIRNRDNRVCQICLMTENENGNRLQVHHIDWDKRNSDPLNLISLCVKCHGKIHTKENTTRDHFTKLALINLEAIE